MLDRREVLLRGLDLAGSVGAEIGPLDRPLVDKADGTVLYVDYCDTEALRKRWSTDAGVTADRIHVDAVWGGNSLREALATATPGKLDYVIASHVIEHVPDLLGWLREVEDVLAPSGTLRLAIPDKRYTFDILRSPTTLAEVLESHVRKRRVPAASRVLDFALNMVEVDLLSAWQGTLDRSRLRHGFTPEQAIGLARDAEENQTYHDVHCWVFTPDSFAELMAVACGHGLVSFACRRFVTTQENTFEFFVELVPCPQAELACASWRQTLGMPAAASTDAH